MQIFRWKKHNSHLGSFINGELEQRLEPQFEGFPILQITKADQSPQALDHRPDAGHGQPLLSCQKLNQHRQCLACLRRRDALRWHHREHQGQKREERSNSSRVRGLGPRGGGRHVVDGGDGGGEVGRWSEGQGLGGEEGAHCGGCGEEVVMLRSRGLGIAVHELLANVCAIFERRFSLYVVVVVVFAHAMVAGFLRVLGHETGF